MFKQYVDSKNDFAFKNIFGSELNKDILITFLNDIVTHNTRPMIKDVTFINSSVSEKNTSIASVLCENENGRRSIIEIHAANEKEVLEHASKAYKDKLKDGSIQEVILLFLVDFIKFPQRDSYKTEMVILENISLTFIELPKFNKKLDELSTILEKWIYFFKNADKSSREELKALVGQDWVLKQACEELRNEEVFTQEIKAKPNYKTILAQSHIDGIEIGNNEDKLEIARSMVASGVGLDIISKCTHLSFEEIAALFPELSVKVKRRKG